MKRRLSVAISLVSDPKIIYLDEPSTGLDPENRRQLWDILAAQKGKRAMILTTHSMEEADVLCNRIGIVNDGILRCVGPQVRLKSIYGGGYHLFVNC
jgi:ABC-type multidrug transport system ATPase subunit